MQQFSQPTRTFPFFKDFFAYIYWKHENQQFRYLNGLLCRTGADLVSAPPPDRDDDGYDGDDGDDGDDGNDGDDGDDGDNGDEGDDGGMVEYRPKAEARNASSVFLMCLRLSPVAG